MSKRGTIILIDHGSRRPEANARLDQLAARLLERRPDWSVRCAHLEMAPPGVPEAIDDCVRDGARDIVLHPFFLLPGRHTREDLPRLAREARARHPHVTIQITETLGLDDRLVGIVLDRIESALSHPSG